MFVELPDGGNLLFRGYAKAVTGQSGLEWGPEKERPPATAPSEGAPVRTTDTVGEIQTERRQSTDPSDGVGVVVSLALITMTAWVLYRFTIPLIEAMQSQYTTRSPWAYALAMAAAFATARLAYYVREIRRKWWEYPAIEIGLGLGLSTLAVKPELHPIINILAFMASIRVIVDGIKRFKEYRREALQANVAAPNVQAAA